VARLTRKNQEEGPRQETAEAEVRALYRRVLTGWNAGSGEAFGAPFSRDAVFIGFDGSVQRGREQIASAHQQLFEKWVKGSRLVDGETTVRLLGPDAAILHAVGGTVMPGRSQPAPERASIQTLVATRAGNEWSFVSFQNTRIRPIGANPISAVLWLIPDKLWSLLFRASKTAARRRTGLAGD
jgi:uncharacterized protein (TIGR02246 family)